MGEEGNLLALALALAGRINVCCSHRTRCVVDDLRLRAKYAFEDIGHRNLLWTLTLRNCVVIYLGSSASDFVVSMERRPRTFMHWIVCCRGSMNANFESPHISRAYASAMSSVLPRPPRTWTVGCLQKQFLEDISVLIKRPKAPYVLFHH